MPSEAQNGESHLEHEQHNLLLVVGAPAKAAVSFTEKTATL